MRLHVPKWLANVLLYCGSIAICLVVLEGYFRLTRPVSAWPGFRFIDKVGIVYDNKVPGLNSMGFYDIERSKEKPDGVFRVLLLGDSFVDNQPVARYLQDELISQSGKRDIEVIPMGISDTGTVNQLVWYQEFGRQFKPDVVIVLFVPNDFANNSNVLEGVRLRFAPYAPGCPFFLKENGQIKPIPLRPDWEKNILAELPSHPSQGILRLPEKNIDSILDSSALYQFVRNKIFALDKESLYHRFDGEYAYRICQLKQYPEIAESLKGWNYPKDLDMDAMFLADGNSIPQVFHDAIDYTAHALSEFKTLSQVDGFDFFYLSQQTRALFFLNHD